jgi:hypothetical protein
LLELKELRFFILGPLILRNLDVLIGFLGMMEKHPDSLPTAVEVKVVKFHLILKLYLY